MSVTNFEDLIKDYSSFDELWNFLFIYEDGILRWARPRSSNIKAGKIAGRLHHHGYIEVRILGKSFQAHRIIYEMHHGDLPPGIQIDHRDLNKSNNKIDNLRKATVSQNQANVGLRSDNKTGYKGVRLDVRSGKYYAQLNIAGKFKFLGAFDVPEEAKAAYDKAASELHGEFFRT